MSDAETLGSELRAARESRDLTLEQAETQTRIRAYYLEALELGNLAALPSEVQGRGFLRNYARFLGLDAELYAARFDSALTGGSRRRRTTKEPPPPPSKGNGSTSRQTATAPLPARESGAVRTAPRTPPAPSSAQVRRRRNRNRTLGTLAIIVISVAALIVLLAFSQQPPSQAGDPNAILSPAPTEETTSTPEIIVTPTRAKPTTLPNPSTLSAPGSVQSGGVTVQITVNERHFLRVLVDGVQAIGDSVDPGTVLQYVGKDSVTIMSGNAGALDVVVNGVPQDPLGQRKEIVTKTYTANSPPATAAPPTSVSQAPPPGAPGLTVTNRTATVENTPQNNTQLASPLAALSSIVPTFAASQPPASATSLAINSPLPSLTATPSASPTRTRIPSITPTASSTPTASRTPIYLPHGTLTPDSRPN